MNLRNILHFFLNYIWRLTKFDFISQCNEIASSFALLAMTTLPPARFTERKVRRRRDKRVRGYAEAGASKDMMTRPLRFRRDPPRYGGATPAPSHA